MMYRYNSLPQLSEINHPYDFSNGEDLLRKSVKECYNFLNADITDLHEKDKTKEDGADLLINTYNDGSKETIAMQLKVKARGNANVEKQLDKLSKREQDRKIFAYWAETPAFDELKHECKEVKFWDNGKLEKFFFNNHSSIYIRLKFATFDIVKNLAKTFLILCSKKDLETNMNNSIEILNDMWEIKDDMVKTKSLLDFIFKKYDEKIRGVELDDTGEAYYNIFKEVVKELENVDEIAINQLLNTLDSFCNKRPDAVKEYWEISSKRSGWRNLNNKLDNSKSLDKSYFIMLKWIVGLEKGERLDIWDFEPRTDLNITIIKDILKSLQQRGIDLEDGIDWLKNDNFGKSYIT